MATQNFTTSFTQSTKQATQQKQIITALDDLILHGDNDAAALALGDLWLTFPTERRAHVVSLVKSLCGASK